MLKRTRCYQSRPGLAFEPNDLPATVAHATALRRGAWDDRTRRVFGFPHNQTVTTR